MRPWSTDQAARRRDGFRVRGGVTTRVEAFVDAAFAFALTLLIISFDALPDSIDALILALKGVPAFAASFLLIATFWRGHVDWSNRYGLDDRAGQRISLLLVFLVLVFVYPLRMVFASLFAFISGGWFPAEFRFQSIDDVRVMFVTFAFAFGSMGTAMMLLYRRAWQARDELGLDAAEAALTRLEIAHWAIVPLFAPVSMLLCLSDTLVRIGLPGFVLFGINIGQWWLGRRRARILAAVPREPPDGSATPRGARADRQTV